MYGLCRELLKKYSQFGNSCSAYCQGRSSFFLGTGGGGVTNFNRRKGGT